MMDWSLAHTLHDVEDIVNMADGFFGHEADGILTRSREVFRHRVTVATTEQLFNKSREFMRCAGVLRLPIMAGSTLTTLIT